MSDSNSILIATLFNIVHFQLEGLESWDFFETWEHLEQICLDYLWHLSYDFVRLNPIHRGEKSVAITISYDSLVLLYVNSDCFFVELASFWSYCRLGRFLRRELLIPVGAGLLTG